MDTWEDIKAIGKGFSGLVPIFAWFVWALFLLWLTFGSGPTLLFARWFWPAVGDQLVKAGIPEGLIVCQMIFGSVGLMLLLMAAPPYLCHHLDKKRNAEEQAQL
jgi:hypothetical protein